MLTGKNSKAVMRVLFYLAIIGFVLLKNMDERAKGKIYGKRHVRRLLKAQTDAELEALNALTPNADPITRDHSSYYQKVDNNTAQHRHIVSEAHDETERCEPENVQELGHTLQDTDEHIEEAIDDIVSNSDCESINSSLRSDCVRKSSDGNSSNCSYEIDSTEAVYVATELSPTEKTERFKHEIRSWALTFDISHRALYHLMPILGRYSEHNFPVDPRTLLETPKSTNIVTLSNGNYCHFNFEDVLKRILVDVKHCTNNQIEQLDLLVSIDGLPISDSSSSCLWPILCSENITKKVHVIGIFHGYSKPRESNEFLQMFVDDIIHFINHGINDESRIVRVHLNGLLCDTPAKSLVLSVKGHAGYYSCTRCTINGEYVENTVCFPTERIQSNLRTDDEFARGMYKNNYQLGNTILKDIPNFGCVSSVPNDYMHVICLGVTKKLIYLLLKRVHNRGLSDKIEEAVTHFLLQVRKTVPIDFDRKPRAFKDFPHWKVKEFGMFLLYLAPRALYKTVSQQVYDNFMTLHVAVTLLTRADLASNRDCINYAEKLLVHFTQKFEEMYGKRYMSHNMHNLLHIAADVRKYGALDEFSCFRFENYMQTLKKLIRKGDKPLQQLARRFHEIEMVERMTEHGLKNSEMRCEKPHNDGPVLDGIDVKCQYKNMYNDKMTIRCDGKNSYCLLSNDKYISIMNIIACTSGELYVIGKKFTRLRSLYEKPLSSDVLHIQVVSSSISRLQMWPVSEIRAKGWTYHLMTSPTLCYLYCIRLCVIIIIYTKL